MKKIVLMAVLATVAMFAVPSTVLAAQVQPLPNDPPYIALFLPVTTLVVLGFSLTGQGAELCSKMGGTWEPMAAGDNCPGGRWARFYGLL